ncbi:MAG: insulinase family protein, partial [Candidatus Dormibacteraceae bacterium]
MNSNHRMHELGGGTKLITAELADRVSASLVLMFGVGSSYERESLGGISHFLEHLVFKGTERRPGAKEVAEAIEGVGGVLNAWT